LPALIAIAAGAAAAYVMTRTRMSEEIISMNVRIEGQVQGWRLPRLCRARGE
jgi:hypothetical protein